jgi:hypothetical protein
LAGFLVAGLRSLAVLSLFFLAEVLFDLGVGSESVIEWTM